MSQKRGRGAGCANALSARGMHQVRVTNVGGRTSASGVVTLPVLSFYIHAYVVSRYLLHASAGFRYEGPALTLAEESTLPLALVPGCS